VVANARKFEEVELDVKGETDEELAASLVAEMLRTGLTAKG
jgi:xanthine/CO dehydrogenase XdhC/CoxF family maturation factor